MGRPDLPTLDDLTTGGALDCPELVPTTTVVEARATELLEGAPVAAFTRKASVLRPRAARAPLVEPDSPVGSPSPWPWTSCANSGGIWP